MLLRSVLRPRNMGPLHLGKMLSARGGGFHKPDPKPYEWVEDTRRLHLEDVNTVFYSDIGPEFHMHLHSLHIQSGKQGWFLIWSYFFLIILPCWLVARKVHKDAGAWLFPAVRPGPDHAHMSPRLLAHLKTHNYEAMPDKFGRRGADFYRNFVR